MRPVFGLAAMALVIPAQELELGKGVNLFSLHEEIKLGQSAAAEFLKSARVIKAPLTSSYLEVLVKGLAGQFTAQHRFTVAVFDDRLPFSPIRDAMPEPAEQQAAKEAIAVPDGSIFVPLTRLKRAESESDLRIVMAHAVAHIADRHVTRLMTRARMVERAAAGMPDKLRREHTLAVAETARQDRKGFEKRADDWALRWLPQLRQPPSRFEEVRKEIARL